MPVQQVCCCVLKLVHKRTSLWQGSVIYSTLHSRVTVGKPAVPTPYHCAALRVSSMHTRLWQCHSWSNSSDIAHATMQRGVAPVACSQCARPSAEQQVEAGSFKGAGDDIFRLALFMIQEAGSTHSPRGYAAFQQRQQQTSPRGTVTFQKQRQGSSGLSSPPPTHPAPRAARTKSREL